MQWASIWGHDEDGEKQCVWRRPGILGLWIALGSRHTSRTTFDANSREPGAIQMLSETLVARDGTYKTKILFDTLNGYESTQDAYRYMLFDILMI